MKSEVNYGIELLKKSEEDCKCFECEEEILEGELVGIGTIDKENSGSPFCCKCTQFLLDAFIQQDKESLELSKVLNKYIESQEYKNYLIIKELRK